MRERKLNKIEYANQLVESGLKEDEIRSILDTLESKGVWK